MEVKIKKLSKDAIVPTYGSEKAAGFDFYANQDAFITPNETMVVSTGLQFEVPEGHVMLIFSRSGVAAKTPLAVKNGVGVIDEDYRGEIGVLLHNTADKNGKQFPAYILTNGEKVEDWKLGYHENNTVRVCKGDRIAQGIIIPVEHVEFIEGKPSKTTRGAGGLGSTGK